jgi:hypothetical protein
MIFSAETLANHAYVFTGQGLVSKSVNSDPIAFVAGDTIHIDVDMETNSLGSMTFNLTQPFTATITDGYRGKHTFTAAEYTSLSGNCVVTFVFNDAVQIPTSYVTIYMTRASASQTLPTWFGEGGTNLSGYLGEDIYVHNDSSQDRCYLYNDQKTSAVKVVANQPPIATKVFDSLEYKANVKYDVTDIDIEANKTYPYGMVSKIPEAKFTLREGIYYAGFLRNQKTNQSTVSDIDLLRGEELRGAAMEVTMVSDDITEANLFSVVVNSSKSRS